MKLLYSNTEFEKNTFLEKLKKYNIPQLFLWNFGISIVLFL